MINKSIKYLQSGQFKAKCALALILIYYITIINNKKNMDVARAFSEEKLLAKQMPLYNK